MTTLPVVVPGRDSSMIDIHASITSRRGVALVGACLAPDTIRCANKKLQSRF